MGNGEQAGVSRVQSPGWGVGMEEVRLVLGRPGHRGLTGSQRRGIRVGVMCCQGLV